MEIQLTGQTAEQRYQATQRSSPSGSRVRTITARDLAGKVRLYSGYCSVTGFRKRILSVVASPCTKPFIPSAKFFIAPIATSHHECCKMATKLFRSSGFKSEAQNPCLRRSCFAQAGEIRNNLKCSNFKCPKQKSLENLNFGNLNLFRISIFGFRIFHPPKTCSVPAMPG